MVWYPPLVFEKLNRYDSQSNVNDFASSLMVGKDQHVMIRSDKYKDWYHLVVFEKLNVYDAEVNCKGSAASLMI